LPERVRYKLCIGSAVLDRDDLLSFVEGWHLNLSCSLILEALHEDAGRQTQFLEGVLGAVMADRRYFPSLHEYMAGFLKGFSEPLALAVDVRGQRLARYNLAGCAPLDVQYETQALECRNVRTIFVLRTYWALERLPRVIDVYRASQWFILIDIGTARWPRRRYEISPSNWENSDRYPQGAVCLLDEDGYRIREEFLQRATVGMALVDG